MISKNYFVIIELHMKCLLLIHPTKMRRQKEIGEPYLKRIDAGLSKIACLKTRGPTLFSNQKQMFQQPSETNSIVFDNRKEA